MLEKKQENKYKYTNISGFSKKGVKDARPKRAVFFSKDDDIKIKRKVSPFFFLQRLSFLLLPFFLCADASVGVLQDNKRRANDQNVSFGISL